MAVFEPATSWILDFKSLFERKSPVSENDEDLQVVCSFRLAVAWLFRLFVIWGAQRARASYAQSRDRFDFCGPQARNPARIWSLLMVS